MHLVGKGVLRTGAGKKVNRAKTDGKDSFIGEPVVLIHGNDMQLIKRLFSVAAGIPELYLRNLQGKREGLNPGNERNGSAPVRHLFPFKNKRRRKLLQSLFKSE